MKSLILIIFTIFVCPGCTYLTYKIPSGITESSLAHENQGLVILSTWSKEKSFIRSTNLVIRKQTDSLPIMLMMDNPYMQSHFEEGWGFVHALRLDPGEYNVTGTVGYELDEWIPFQVRKGDMLYLGEISVITSDGEKNFLRVKDQSDRDLGIFLESNPSIDKKNIRFGGNQ